MHCWRRQHLNERGAEEKAKLSKFEEIAKDEAGVKRLIDNASDELME
jgi:hypothetical protein